MLRGRSPRYVKAPHPFHKVVSIFRHGGRKEYVKSDFKKTTLGINFNIHSFYLCQPAIFPGFHQGSEKFYFKGIIKYSFIGSECFIFPAPFFMDL